MNDRAITAPPASTLHSDVAGWLLGASALLAATTAFQVAAPLFDIRHSLIDAPIWSLVAAFVAAGAVHALLLPRLVGGTRARPNGDKPTPQAILALIVITGVAARLILLPGSLVLDDDAYRYLWDGAVTAHGYDPYLQSPTLAAKEPRSPELARLAEAGAEIRRSINHPDLSTIYPPVAQAAFALGHVLSPFSIVGWRLVVLALELVLLAGILAFLHDCGRSPLWAALYWWHPLVLKELAHAGHMEAVLLPLVVWSVVLAGRGALLWATLLLAAATATKFWPALLLPLILRQAMATTLRPNTRVVLLGLVFAVATLALLWPLLRHGLRDDSGLVAYARYWTTNSAFFPAFERILRLMLSFLALADVTVALIGKLLVGAALAGLAAVLAASRSATMDELVGKVAVLIATLVLVAPSQFPWYTLWFAPFLAARPYPVMLAIGITVPLYYGSFHFAARNQVSVFADGIVWAIWLPVWLVLALSWWRSSPRSSRSLG